MKHTSKFNSTFWFVCLFGSDIFFFFCDQLRPWAKARHICWVLSQFYVIFDLCNNQWSYALKGKSIMQLVEPVLLCWVNHDGQTSMITSKLHPSLWNDALSWTLNLDCAVSVSQANREGENRMSNQIQTQEYHDVPGPWKCHVQRGQQKMQKVHKYAVTHWHTEWYVTTDSKS